MERAFISRRIHSLFGLWIVIFLCEHLLTNSQAGLMESENWAGFVRAVNFLHNLPYLHVIEVVLLGVPILLHAVWGLQYIFASKGNAHPTAGSGPAMGGERRNRAYSLQRWSSWILLIGLVLHVGYMRFYRYPDREIVGSQTSYYVKVNDEQGLGALSKRLDFTYEVKGDGVIAKCDTFGTATLLTVRDAFHSPIKCVLYSIFVLAACFHGFNGLWTFCITWGVVIRMRSQRQVLNVCYAVGLLLLFLGFASIWGSYWSFS